VDRWRPEVGERVIINTVAMRHRHQHGVVQRYERKDPQRVFVRWIYPNQPRRHGRSRSYHVTSLRPCDDAITRLGELTYG